MGNRGADESDVSQVVLWVVVVVLDLEISRTKFS